jgi:hypothetical protein
MKNSWNETDIVQCSKRHQRALAYTFVLILWYKKKEFSNSRIHIKWHYFLERTKRVLKVKHFFELNYGVAIALHMRLSVDTLGLSAVCSVHINGVLVSWSPKIGLSALCPWQQFYLIIYLLIFYSFTVVIYLFNFIRNAQNVYYQ